MERYTVRKEFSKDISVIIIVNYIESERKIVEEELLKNISIIIVTSIESMEMEIVDEELIRLCRKIEFKYIDNNK